ncbi:MAG: leucyl aminopeptidase [Planctomycetota bacterium]|nr:leucyl aminopeptidase [Planctomycetota bacterium]
MRIRLQDKVAAGRDDLHAILVPKGATPKLPSGAPPAAAWKSDLELDGAGPVLVHGAGGQRWLLLRLGAPKKLHSEEVRGAAGSARNAAEIFGRKRLVIDLSLLPAGDGWVQAAAEGAGMAGYDHAVMKEKRKKAKVRECLIAGAGASAAAKKEASRGELAAAGNLFARELSNLPANVLTPREFAKRARKVAASSARVSVRVHGRKDLERMKAGSLLGVAQGSAEEPQLVHLVYKPKGRARGKLALVGKGLTFDTGGISLKPSGNMQDMKFDMCGGAAVLGAFHALALGAECHYEVHGVLGCVENMPDGAAQRPGDIVTAMNGMTIEVHNTDAEGRLVLADCLTYTARKIKPDRIYDVATLTGAAIIALGHLHTAVLGNDQKAVEETIGAGARAGEPIWQLPLTEDYRDLTRGSYADLQNIYAPGQGAGTIAGASFLSFFVDEVPWVHLDIAATAWEGPKRSYFTPGGRGPMVRTFLEILRS